MLTNNSKMARMIDDNKAVENQNTAGLVDTANQGNATNQGNGDVSNPAQEEGTNDLTTLQSILERLDTLEKENEELKKGQLNVFTEGKKFYEWPRDYSYKMWWGVPVLAYKSFRKDATKDLVYQNQYGAWVSNHYLELTLANKKKVEVEVNEFNKHYTTSEKMRAEKTTDNRGNVLGYEFEVEPRWKFIVATNLLNE